MKSHPFQHPEDIRPVVLGAVAGTGPDRGLDLLTRGSNSGAYADWDGYGPAARLRRATSPLIVE